MMFEGETEAIKVNQNQDNTFTVRIDKSKLELKTKQYFVKIRLQDSNGLENWMTHQIIVDVNFEDKQAKAIKEAKEAREAIEAEEEAEKEALRQKEALEQETENKEDEKSNAE